MVRGQEKSIQERKKRMFVVPGVLCDIRGKSD